MAPDEATGQGADPPLGVWRVATIGVVLVLCLPTCLGFGWMDRRNAQQDREIAALKAELAKQKDATAAVEQRLLALEAELKKLKAQSGNVAPPPPSPKKE